MSGGNRGFILAAVFGLTAFSIGAGYTFAELNNPEEQRYERYRYAPGDPDAAKAALADKTQPIEYREPCKAPEGQNESDLCAQWKAARAAEAGALWAERGFWASVLSILGLGATILLTLKAVNAAARATEIADAQLNQMRQEARAWLAITDEPQKVAIIQDSLRFYYVIRIQNVGSTVAHDVDLRHAVFDSEDPRKPIDRHVAKWSHHPAKKGAAIMPGETASATLWSFQARDNFKVSKIGNFIYPAVLVYVRYRVTSDAEEHVSRRVFRFGTVRDADDILSRYTDPVTLLIGLDDSLIPADKLQLESFGAFAT